MKCDSNSSQSPWSETLDSRNVSWFIREQARYGTKWKGSTHRSCSGRGKVDPLWMRKHQDCSNSRKRGKRKCQMCSIVVLTRCRPMWTNQEAEQFWVFINVASQVATLIYFPNADTAVHDGCNTQPRWGVTSKLATPTLAKPRTGASVQLLMLTQWQ